MRRVLITENRVVSPTKDPSWFAQLEFWKVVYSRGFEEGTRVLSEVCKQGTSVVNSSYMVNLRWFDQIIYNINTEIIRLF